MAYRVIQWATGAMGRSVLRAVIDSPSTELVGLFVYGEAKAGKDAGEIVRRPTTGVIATRNVEDILRLDADVVIHCARLAPPYGSHDDEIIRLLASGKNVISINGYSHPSHWKGERRERLEAACRAGNSSLMAGGLNPGYIGEQLSVVATSLCQSLEHLEVIESADSRVIRNATYAFDILGFGQDPAKVNPNDPNWGPAGSLNGMYEEVIAAMAAHLGMDLERVETDHRVYPATEDLQVAAGLIPQGTISHVNWRWNGIVAGANRLTMSIHWWMEEAHFGGDKPPLWRVRMRGHPGVKIDLELEKHEQDTTPAGAEQIALGGSILNSIPFVVRAKPGLVLRPLATPYRDDLAALAP